MHWVFYILGGISLLVWIAGYIWISSLACAFSQNATCTIPAPWSLRGEDFIFLFLLPGAVVLILFALGRRLQTKSRSNAQNSDI